MSAKAILIGCARYDSQGIRSLQFAEQDAEQLNRRLIDPDIGGYSSGEVHLLTSPDHRTAATLLARVVKSAAPEDSLLFYFAGHGLRDENGQLHLAMKDSDPDLLEVTSIPARQVRELLDVSRSRQICVILDCCFSGAIGNRTSVSSVDISQSLNSLTGEGTVILTSAQPSQEARERPDLGHGVFTKYLLQGIDGEADVDGDGVITPVDLYNYVALKMEQDVGRTQRPTLSSNLAGGVFPLVRSGSRRSKALDALGREINRLCGEKLHGEALGMLSGFREAGPRDRQGLLAMRERVEKEKRELIAGLRQAVLGAAGRGELSDATLQAVLEQLSSNSDAPFVARPKELNERILRNYLIGRLDANALEDTWPHTKHLGSALESIPPIPTPELPNSAGEAPASPAQEVPGPTMSVPGTRLRPLFRALSRPGLWLTVLAAAASLWIVMNRPPATGPMRLRVGVMLKPGWKEADAKAIYGMVAEKLATELKDHGDFRPEVTLYTDIHMILSKLKNGQLDLAGELSPHDIFEVQQVGAEPFVTAWYEGKQHYKAVVVVSKRPQSTSPEGPAQVRVDSWERVLESLKDGRGRLAVSDESSTSGYWFPRSLLIGEFREREWNLSFRDVIIQMPSSEILQSVACGTQLIVAGVVASFKLPKDRAFQCGQERVEVAPVQETAGILNGGYVVSAVIVGNGRLLRAYKKGWMKSVSQLTEEQRNLLSFPPEWSEVDGSYYEPMNKVFKERDLVEDRTSRVQKTALSAAALILLLCAAAFHRLRSAAVAS